MEVSERDYETILSQVRSQKLMIMALIFAFIFLSFIVWERSYDSEIRTHRLQISNIKNREDRIEERLELLEKENHDVEANQSNER